MAPQQEKKRIIGPISVTRESYVFFSNNLLLIAQFVLGFVFIFNLLEYGLDNFAAGALGAERAGLIKLLLSLVLGAAYQCGFIVMLTQLNRGTKAQDLSVLLCLRVGVKYVGVYLVASILANIFIFVGLLFLIVPGVYIYARLALFDFFVVIGEEGPIEAMQDSWYLARAKVISIATAVLPIWVLMLGFMLAGSIISADTIAAKIAANLVFWGLGSFLIIIRYRFFVLLLEEHKARRKQRKKEDSKRQ